MTPPSVRRAAWVYDSAVADALVSGLLDPAVYPHAVDRVELVETHISWVFLAGERVYKVKKPVNLGFLDFTTLARRRRFCHEEVRLNRRLAPDVYLDVIDIKGTRRAPRFGGAGRAIEVAVVMRRLPAERMLESLVKGDAAPPELLDAIGVTVARFHAGAETGGEIDELGGLETMRRNWEENFAQTDALGPEILPDATRARVRAYVAAFLEREAARFAARVAAGKSRDCHGDLQAQHVCCVEPVQIFDCIEFNHRFRFGDVAGEIAFLAMDLERLGRPDLAIRFLNAYLEETGDYEAVPLLDFYRAYRAWVRGKVLSFLVADHPERAAEARALFALAARFAAPERRPRLLVTTGVMGSGKSTAARLAAARLGAIVIRTDAVQEAARRPAAPRARRRRVRRGAVHPRDEPAHLCRGPAAGRRAAPRGLARHRRRRVLSRRGAGGGARGRRPSPRTVHDPLVRRAGRGARGAAPRRSEDRHEVSDGREELLALHRARYETPAAEPGVIRLDTTGDSARAVEAALRELERSAEG